MGSDNNISQAPNSGYVIWYFSIKISFVFECSFYQQPDGRVPVAGIYGPQGYGPRILNDANFYPGKPQSYYLPQRQAFQGGYFPPPRGQMRQGLSGVYVKHQPRPYW